MSAAASLKAAFTEYGKQFSGADVRFSFAGSDELAAQIEQGVKPDVYAAANTKLPDELYSKGLVEKPTVFAGNELVLAVPADSDKVDSLEDLTKDGVTIAIGQEDVPVGSYTRTVLDKLPAKQSEAILANVRSEEPDVAGITGKLTQGAVDAGFLYASDVAATDGELKAIELPDDLQPEVAYGAAVVKGAKQPELAQAVHRRAARRSRRAGAEGRGLPAAARRSEARRAGSAALLVAALTVALLFLTLPIVAIFVDTSPAELVASLGEEGALEALRLSLVCSAVAVAIIVVVGTPAAYLLATRRFRGRAALVTLVELPLVLPPAVAGIGLLAALGPNGVLGGLIEDAGIQLVLTTAGVILALTFVAAPFYLRQAQAGFEALDRTWLDASRTLGAGEARTFLRVAIPAAGPSLVSGLALAWGRALGEFGATLMFAGSFRGITQTVPLAIYERFSTDFTSALALSAVLVAVSGALLLSVKLLSGSAWLGGAAR